MLAPPYDVIDDHLRAQLHARDPHNISRIDAPSPGDDTGGTDRYQSAAAELRRWVREGILVRDDQPGLYLCRHRFNRPGGGTGERGGIFGLIAARPWDQAPIRPHERTLRGPKRDRLELMRATAMQTSAVFGLWDRASGVEAAMDRVSAEAPPLLRARLPGELGEEEIQLWAVTGPLEEAVRAALSRARLHVADGHHRYETAVTYAQERRLAEPNPGGGAAYEDCLVQLCSAADPDLLLLPTHRLLGSVPGIPSTVGEVVGTLPDGFSATEVPGPEAALAGLRERRAAEHAFGMVSADGVVVVSRPRRPGVGPVEGLDVAVLEASLLSRWGLAPSDIAAGAIGYTRDPGEVVREVVSGAQRLGVLLNGCSTAEMVAVSVAGGIMPQKSTYFYPKVPTGLVISPL